MRRTKERRDLSLFDAIEVYYINTLLLLLLVMLRGVVGTLLTEHLSRHPSTCLGIVFSARKEESNAERQWPWMFDEQEEEKRGT